jgi:hypothetical protein
MAIKKKKNILFSPLNQLTVVMNILTSKQQDICTYAGSFGAMISAACFVQLMVISRDHWLAFVLLGINAFAILAFILLALQKAVAPLLLIAVAALLFLAKLVYIFSGVFSLLVLISFLYSMVVVAVLFVEQLPKKLKEKALAEKAESLVWKDKI